MMNISQQKVIVRTDAPAQRGRGFPWALLLALLLIGGGALWLFSWEGQMQAAVYPGVRIAGVDIGGLTLDQARARLIPLERGIEDRPLTVTAGDQRWTTTPRRLGLQLDIDQRLQQAYALGREADWVDRYSTQIDLALHGRRLSLAGNYDNNALQTFLQRVAVATYRPARPATVALEQQRATISVDAQEGRQLDRRAANAVLAGALADPRQAAVTLPIETTPAPVRQSEAAREVAALNAMLKTRLHLHFGARQWVLGAEVIAPAISLTTITADGGYATYQHNVNTAVLQQFVDNIGAQIDRPVREATVAVRGATLTVVPGQNGYQLDGTTTLQVLTQAILQGGEQDVNLAVSVTTPQTPTDAAQRAARQAAELIRRPPALTYGGRQWLLRPDQLAAALRFTPRQDPLSGPQLDVHVDPALLAGVLAPVAAAVAQAPVDARFVVQGDRVAIVPSEPGLRLDVAALAPRIEGRGRTDRLAIPTAPVQPRRSTVQAQAMGIDGLLLSHSTTFPGSSVARLTNIHAAVQHLDGQLIAPGEIFSFDNRIGDITAAGGYVEGINIIDNQDVPGIGGGVCQVAVTLFQAAVYAGMPILERIPHANVVGYYNPIGMDATVYVAPGGPDVKFQNNTGHWVLIDFQEDLPHNRLTVRFFGTDPHHTVVVRGPYVSHEANGSVDAVFYRTVYDAAGKLILNAHFNSHYVPATTG